MEASRAGLGALEGSGQPQPSPPWRCRKRGLRNFLLARRAPGGPGGRGRGPAPAAPSSGWSSAGGLGRGRLQAGIWGPLCPAGGLRSAPSWVPGPPRLDACQPRFLRGPACGHHQREWPASAVPGRPHPGLAQSLLLESPSPGSLSVRRGPSCPGTDTGRCQGSRAGVMRRRPRALRAAPDPAVSPRHPGPCQPLSLCTPHLP